MGGERRLGPPHRMVLAEAEALRPGASLVLLPRWHSYTRPGWEAGTGQSGLTAEAFCIKEKPNGSNQAFLTMATASCT